MMKRLWMLFGLLAVLFPMTAAAQQVENTIEDIAASVVLIEARDRFGPVGTGSGTIISPDGLIYTNQHVIDGANDYAIYMLDDIRELPVLRYFATPYYISPELDFAILQIDRDADGRTVRPEQEALPYLTPNNAEATIGERIRIFGYPGIGEGYMVVTSGEVVTVQNGDIGGMRLPVWYWTDAEISSGNSGGLVVNENGEFLGLPTWVISEERTAGRLGGVLPITAILQSMSTAPSASTAAEGSSAELGSIRIVNEAPAVNICAVYISLSTAREWGENQLDINELIRSGAARTWNFPQGTYDMLLLDCNGVTLDDVRNVRIGRKTEFVFTGMGSDFSVESQEQGETSQVTLQNNSDITICYVQISPETSDTWGEDHLASDEVIRPGGKRLWNFPAGVYDVRFLDCEQETLLEDYGISMFGPITLTYP